MKRSEWKIAWIEQPTNPDKVLVELYDGDYETARFEHGRWSIPGVYAWHYITNAPERRKPTNYSKLLVMEGHEIGRIAGGLYGQEETR